MQFRSSTRRFIFKTASLYVQYNISKCNLILIFENNTNVTYRFPELHYLIVVIGYPHLQKFSLSEGKNHLVVIHKLDTCEEILPI